MPLDEFQKSVIAVISRNCGPGSLFTGGGVIQQHGIRLTDDQDIVVAEEEFLDRLARTDLEALKDAGFEVQLRRSYPGFRDCRVMKPLVGTTALQWTAALASEYFAPVPDDLFGYRLHFADLAVNKAVAAASRMKKRDFLDLVMLDRHVMPLWRTACAAAGKRPDINPFSMVERMSRNWDIAVRRDDPGDRLVLATDMQLEEIGEGLDAICCEARATLEDVPPGSYGRLQVEDAGQPVTAREITSGGTWMVPRRGGALPAFAGMDSEMIAGLIAEHGRDGSRYTGQIANAGPDSGIGLDGPEDSGSSFDM